MALTFETTHEYYLKDAHMHYCEDHNGLVVSQDFEDRVVLTGIKPETILKFAQEIVKKSIEKQVNKASKPRKTTKKDPVDAAYSA
tara:strand:- start:135 stop:389 length:255 start_codon:yes stop_codon:yes gene_type:complete